MKKTLFAIAITLCFCLNVFSQVTSLEIDCQTPGWLSSMINYGDQLTLENIKVTGYINDTDLTFLGSLNKNQQLNGVINLEDVQIVAENNSENNKLTKGYFGNHIKHLILPKSLVSAKECLAGATLDTLTIGGDSLPSINCHLFYENIYHNDGIRFNKSVKHLILREGVKTIEGHAFYNGSYYQAEEAKCIFESIVLPQSLVTIEESAFEGCYSLKKAELTDNIETLGDYAFAATKIYSDNDTIRLPNKLKKFHLSSFAKRGKSYYTTGEVADIECFGNQHIYIPNSVESIDGGFVSLFGGLYEKCYLHINNENPPSLINMYSSKYSLLVVYVPKAAIDIYNSDPIWQNTTIMAEPNPAKSIDIDTESIDIVKGKTLQLSFIVTPEDADDKSVIWSVSDPNVISVSQDGMVTAKSSGMSKVFAKLTVNNTIMDSCIVRVYQPVTSISLNTTAKDVKVGDIFSLEATISPDDADNKNIIWSSEDEELAIVADGKVTALKPGIVRIYAISDYNNQISAFCEVTITQPTTGIELNYNSYTLNGIGDYVQLEATITPEDASDKTVIWKSSNESVCIVSNGKVVAVGHGIAVIIATTEDSGYMATCTITVEDASEISSINYRRASSYKVYTLDGKPSTLSTKGIKLIIFSDGSTRRVLVK